MNMSSDMTTGLKQPADAGPAASVCRTTRETREEVCLRGALIAKKDTSFCANTIIHKLRKTDHRNPIILS